MNKFYVQYLLLQCMLVMHCFSVISGDSGLLSTTSQEEQLQSIEQSQEQTALNMVDPEAQKNYEQALQNINYGLYTINNGISVVSSLLYCGALAAGMYYLYTMSGATESLIGNDNPGAGKAEVILPGKKGALKFSDVAGLSTAKRAMLDLISSRENKLGGKPLKGVLMTGGPGNGKTLLAKAVAGELGLPFISTSGTNFKTKFANGGAGEIRNVFKQARDLGKKYGACILFIDEIDAIAAKRDGSALGGGSQDSVATTNALLTEMDGLGKDTSVIVLAATNRLDVLDAAATRPGRFDRIIEVQKPNAYDRKELLTIALKPVPKEMAVVHQLDRLVVATEGFSGAEVANVINEAVILAGNAKRERLSVADIDLALDNIKHGSIIEHSDLSDEEKVDLALYQAGCAIATDILDKNKKIQRISIQPREKSKFGVIDAKTLDQRKKISQDDMKNSIIIALAGSLSQAMYGSVTMDDMNIDPIVYELAYGITAKYNSRFHEFRKYAYSDMMRLPSVSTQHIKAAMNLIIEECSKQALILVQQHEQYIYKIAELTFEKGTLAAGDFYSVVYANSVENSVRQQQRLDFANEEFDAQPYNSTDYSYGESSDDFSAFKPVRLSSRPQPPVLQQIPGRARMNLE